MHAQPGKRIGWLKVGFHSREWRLDVRPQRTRRPLTAQMVETGRRRAPFAKSSRHCSIVLEGHQLVEVCANARGDDPDEAHYRAPFAQGDVILEMFTLRAVPPTQLSFFRVSF